MKLTQKRNRSLDDNGYVVVTPAAGHCDVCGAWVELWSGWANECECGTEYNGFGQRLAPRSQWGEETGEIFGEFDNPLEYY